MSDFSNIYNQILAELMHLGMDTSKIALDSFWIWTTFKMSDQGNDLDYRNVLNYVQAILVSKKAEVGQIQLHLRDKSTAPYSYKKIFH